MQKDRELFRPQYHFTPERQWMNDPNGMVYFDGEYHLFYQYHPSGTTWGPMHWGHAVSKDLVHWRHLPVALAPDEHGMIFSGSAVVDWEDTTGWFEGRPGLVAIFTHATEDPVTKRPIQRQSLAFSKDRGRTWTKFVGNPVLTEEEIPDFRDPKVFWHEQTKRWVMALAAGQTIRLYTSPNLKEWTFASSFGEREGSHEGVWECPDLFPLPVDGDSAKQQWVLLVSIGDDPAYEAGSRTQYFIGDFDGTEFVNNNPPDKVLWLDGGRDNYAGVTWSDIPADDGRRLFIGWMSNWRYANVTPTERWRGVMTVPRELSLRTTEEGVRLFQKPAAELRSLRKNPVRRKNLLIQPHSPFMHQPSTDILEIRAEFQTGSADEFGIIFQHSVDEKTYVVYDAGDGWLSVDRSRSGRKNFHEAFAGQHEVHVSPHDGIVKLHVFLDTSSVEVFANDGECSITDLIFPLSQELRILLFSSGGETTLTSLELHELKSVRT